MVECYPIVTLLAFPAVDQSHLDKIFALKQATIYIALDVSVGLRTWLFIRDFPELFTAKILEHGAIQN